jgi:16S rRNA (guanine527-N7)-methyltransferase
LLIDLGSGGGSPGVILNVARPSLQLVLVESKARKSAFLREATRELKLENSKVVTARFEDLLTRPDLHEAAAYVSIRAVRADDGVWGVLQAFLKPGGRVLWFTSREARPVIPTAFAVLAMEPLLATTSSQLVIAARRPAAKIRAGD